MLIQTINNKYKGLNQKNNKMMNKQETYFCGDPRCKKTAKYWSSCFSNFYCETHNQEKHGKEHAYQETQYITSLLHKFQHRKDKTLDEVRVELINVDEGDCIAVYWYGKKILIDLGYHLSVLNLLQIGTFFEPKDYYSQFTKWYHDPEKNKIPKIHLDYLIITHPHDDHYGGLLRTDEYICKILNSTKFWFFKLFEVSNFKYYNCDFLSSLLQEDIKNFFLAMVGKEKNDEEKEEEEEEEGNGSLGVRQIENFFRSYSAFNSIFVKKIRKTDNVVEDCVFLWKVIQNKFDQEDNCQFLDFMLDDLRIHLQNLYFENLQKNVEKLTDEETGLLKQPKGQFSKYFSLTKKILKNSQIRKGNDMSAHILIRNADETKNLIFFGDRTVDELNFKKLNLDQKQYDVVKLPHHGSMRILDLSSRLNSKLWLLPSSTREKIHPPIEDNLTKRYNEWESYNENDSINVYCSGIKFFDVLKFGSYFNKNCYQKWKNDFSAKYSKRPSIDINFKFLGYTNDFLDILIN
ncbi:DNA inteRNAlization/competence protein comec/rec2 [Anaeramoeba flamelloides]|uniref:DNA inteRNAlization/competence protein comec/rec2 n=1 Tax=Anaeramoeba flamelloides TaxID=1746091 RepID=A0ABQ8Y4B3_9EUKA|nr:DNA inteRNAlization/competence protein comec/rec2 [Anaeramoeba flamelloides]